MSISVLPDQNAQGGKKEQVEKMFDDIALNYDFLNRLLSWRVDVRWRKKVVSLLRKHKPLQILDIATGTADLALALATLKPQKIIGVDISNKMLEIGRQKVNKNLLERMIVLQKADAENLPFPDNHFDAITVAFGVRNFENLQKGLAEIHRVLKPGGQFIILEFSKVSKFPVKQLYDLYFSFVTPIIGKLISKSRNAYTYLPKSVAVFPQGDEMCVILQKSQFESPQCIPLTFGIASIYHCSKK